MFTIELQCLFVLFVHGQCQGEVLLFYELDEACAYALRLVARVDKESFNMVSVEPYEACNFAFLFIDVYVGRG